MTNGDSASDIFHVLLTDLRVAVTPILVAGAGLLIPMALMRAQELIESRLLPATS